MANEQKQSKKSKNARMRVEGGYANGKGENSPTFKKWVV